MKIGEEEVSLAISECGGDKAPDLYGFSFRATLNVLKTNFCSILSGFHRKGRLNKEINATFLALVYLREFRSISLVGFEYKLLSKVLANRLKIDLPFIIGPFEGAFVKSRQILDGV